MDSSSGRYAQLKGSAAMVAQTTSIFCSLMQ
jgi:hypothetical protein